MPPVSRVCELCGIGFWDSSPGSIKRRYCAVCEHLPAGVKRINMELRAPSDPARESRIKAVVEEIRLIRSWFTEIVTGNRPVTLNPKQAQVFVSHLTEILDALAAGEERHE